MQLNEETSSAISEIGNLCIAGGSNKISAFSDEVVDISVVQAEIRDSQELMFEIDPTDTCKDFVGLGVSGDINGYFLAKISDEIVDRTISKFPKLNASTNGGNKYESLLELVDNFLVGFADGMGGMTGLSVVPDGTAKKVEEIDFNNFPKKVLCYSSIITVGDERIDFDVYFFSDAEVLIPKVLESLGL
ncbi:MAG: hypothetical protein LW817_06250 [Candidatus Caenarcaniphilales bacterium]|jgi:CheY-specific phosphatase CheX|nr:hypothetical protein [Candidatus Caenarcaniphilales bacterium]